jgi:hypothetical protein
VSASLASSAAADDDETEASRKEARNGGCGSGWVILKTVDCSDATMDGLLGSFAIGCGMNPFAILLSSTGRILVIISREIDARLVEIALL